MTMTRISISSTIGAMALAAFAGVSFPHAASGLDVTITTGDRATPGGLVCAKTDLTDKGDYALMVDEHGAMAAQLDAEGQLWLWSPAMDAGQSRTYPLRRAQLGTPDVRVKQTAEGVITVTVGGKLFTALNFKKDEPKVYLYPVIGPTGDPVTRDYPMKDNPIEKDQPKTRQDHHHHRSIWCAHGVVRTDNFDGTANYWHEPEPAKQDRQKLKRIVRTASGMVFGQIEAEIEWVTRTGVRQFTELRTYTFFAGKNERIIDVRNVFKFTDSDATFGDTKEGGILSIRTAVMLDEQGIKKPKEMHGQMTNIHGQKGEKGEKGCWGKPAAWCDYVGPVFSDDADKVSTVGIAVFDHPKNFRHPARWHIRGYGLYTANPFGWSDFMRDKSKDGSHTWKKGKTAEFNYRILIHKGDTRAARVADHWTLYSDPPKVTCK